MESFYKLRSCGKYEESLKLLLDLVEKRVPSACFERFLLVTTENFDVDMNEEDFQLLFYAIEERNPVYLCVFDEAQSANAFEGSEYIDPGGEYRDSKHPFVMGYNCLQENEDEEAFEWFMKGSEEKDVLCIHEVAKCYKSGRGPMYDKSKACEYFEKASNLHFARSMYSWAEILRNSWE